MTPLIVEFQTRPRLRAKCKTCTGTAFANPKSLAWIRTSIFQASVNSKSCEPENSGIHERVSLVPYVRISTEHRFSHPGDWDPSRVPRSVLLFFVFFSHRASVAFRFFNVRPSFLFMYWQLTVSVAVSAAEWSEGSATTRGRNERHRNSRAVPAPCAAAGVAATASIRPIFWPSPEVEAPRPPARHPRHPTTRVFQASTLRPQLPRTAHPRTNILQHSRPCPTTEASRRTVSQAPRPRPWCLVTGTSRSPEDPGRPAGAAVHPRRPRMDWSPSTTIWASAPPRTAALSSHWTKAPSRCPRWGVDHCQGRLAPTTARYNEAHRTYWPAAL